MTAAFPGDGELVGAIVSQKLRLVRFIGSGGMGIVYEAQPLAGGSPVAVKMLRAEYLDDVEVLTRFVDEGHLCQRLQHPNIARVFEVGHAEDTTPYLVMELCDGIPLASYTENGGRVPLVQAATIVQGILQGLSAAHAQGVVHRDLKPENVILAREPNGKYTPKILDFGIAKVMDQAGGMGKKTATGVLLGTPAYMSPEQIRSAKDCDARSDLWSVGVMLYEMLTGRSAFPAPTAFARLGAVLNTTPPPVESIDPQLARVSAFMQRAMAKDRNLRFQSAQEMGRVLAEAMGEGEGRQEALSRLPDMPAFMSQQAPPVVPSIVMSRAHSPKATTADSFQLGPDGRVLGPSGTLASSPPSPRVSEPPSPPVVQVVAAQGGTLPSNDLPVLEPVASGVASVRGGVPVWVVVLVGLAGVAVGLGLGFVLFGRG
ncbi:MAG: serine/threonine protein kinase [Myxococcales bacterium]|nr:serine/threonine protein kinase [Myxococcales bacterium]